ncbi:MAG: hypothetical protein ACI4WH_03540 [Oscillospiraceae bacterium]
MDFVRSIFKNKEIQSIEDTIKNECGENNITIKYIKTKNETWQSVIDADDYFKNVILFTNIDEFIKEVKSNLGLNSLEVSKFILGKISCTYDVLIKILINSYNSYYDIFKKSLFLDKDFKYLNEKFGYYKNSNRTLPDYKELNFATMSKISNSSDGLNKLHTIENEINKHLKEI